ncbi:MAG: hypothetical protein Q9222_001566 [Ikaeria aurantiellina]
MKRHPFPLLTALHLLSLIKQTCQVNIRLDLVPSAAQNSQLMSSLCLNIPPGICCRFPIIGAAAVTFEHLTAFDIAAVWQLRADLSQQQNNGKDCSGRVADTRPGPGNWRWESRGSLITAERATGGSFITLPRSLPPDDTAQSWMRVEGLLALAWGGRRWFASPSVERLLVGSNGGGAGGGIPRSRTRRDIRSDDKGTLHARSPAREVLPDWIEWNKTEFTKLHDENFLYTDSSGGIANLTGMVSSRNDPSADPSKLNQQMVTIVAMGAALVASLAEVKITQVTHITVEDR